MADDITTLIIEIKSDKVAKARKELNRLDKQSKTTEKRNEKLSDSFRTVAASIGAAAAAGFALRRSFTALKEFQVLDAQLRTATGSADAAAEKFEELEKFALTMPDGLNDIVAAFVKLKNLGLDPSEQALLSYANTASAMGKSLDQFIEAVADAATAEFERLKEFGIRAKNQGETIAFTFRGVTTEVANNAKAIEGFLQRIGKEEFFGAAAERAKTLEGAISNVDAAMDKFFRSLSDNEAVGGNFVRLLNLATISFNNWADTFNPGKEQQRIERMNDLRNEIMGLNREIKVLESSPTQLALQNSFVGKLFNARSLDELKTKVAALTAEYAALVRAGSKVEPAQDAGSLVITGDPLAGLLDPLTGDLPDVARDEYAELIDDLNKQTDTFVDSWEHAAGRISVTTRSLFEKMPEWAELSTRQQLGAFETMASGLAALAAQTEGRESSRYKELSKVAVIANTAGAIMRAYQDLGYVAGSVAAIGLAATGKAQLNAIESNSIAGGGPGINISGGGAPQQGTSEFVLGESIRTSGIASGTRPVQNNIRFEIKTIDSSDMRSAIISQKGTIMRVVQDATRERAR
jgi:archaellum component FlaC